jgi:cell wall-associated NlpC family hydrolase
VYNCHGLTFAARRTGIDPDAFDFQRLLEEDCYELVDQERNALPGDVVLYYDSSGKLQHSGMVIAGPENGFGFPRVLSKWGRWGEVIHLAHVVSELYGPTREYRRVVR